MVKASEKLSETAVAATSIPPALPTPAATKVTETMEKTIASVTRYEEITAAGKANIDALVEANTVFFSGFQALSKEMFSLTQASMEQAAAATTAMLSAKTLKDVMELNTGFAKSQYEKLLHDSGKLGELTIKLATETAAPLAARATHAIEDAVRHRA
jgi:phasin family protein